MEDVDEDWLEIDMIFEAMYPYINEANKRIPLWYSGIINLGELLSLPVAVEGSTVIQSRC